jgi:hypothetical protein
VATFGKTATGSSSSSSSATKGAVSAATPAETGIVATGTARLSIDSGSTQVKFAIYANSGGSPGTKLAESDVLTLSATAATWLTFTFSGANKIQVIAGTSYWIGVLWQDPAGSVTFYRDSDSNGRVEAEDFTWPTLPSPYGPTTRVLSGPIDAYVTYDTATLIGPVLDGGQGNDDGISLARTRYVALDETGAGLDLGEALHLDPPLAEGGEGSEAISIQILDPIGPVLDSGAGTDEVLVADFDAFDHVEEGVGTDTITVERLTFIQLDETAVGDDSRALEQTRSLTDEGVGTDTRSSQQQVVLAELSVGTEFVRVVDIPFTQILPLREGTLYELVVVARVPQIAGPPTFLEVDAIEWKDLRYTNTISQAQEMEASAQISSVSEAILQRLRRPHEHATELWIYRNGQIVFAGPLVGWRSSGENLTISARGLLAYLRLMIVERDLLFVQQDQFLFVKTMVDNWQGLEFGHFGIDTSGIGLSGVLRDGTYYRKELHNVGQRVEELGQRIDGFDAEVDPATRRLQLWHPLKGVDRSTGEDAIVIDARNIASSDTLCSVAIGDLASQGYGTGTASGADTALWSEQSNDDLRTKYGRTAVTATWSDVSDQSTLDAHTRGLIDARKEALIVPGPNVRVTPDADLEAYAAGDTITYDLAGALGVYGAFRIRRQSIKVSSTGKETVDLEFV